MSKTKNILQQAASKYSSFLCAYIHDELDIFFPLIINKFSERANTNDNREEQKLKLEKVQTEVNKQYGVMNFAINKHFKHLN